MECRHCTQWAVLPGGSLILFDTPRSVLNTFYYDVLVSVRRGRKSTNPSTVSESEYNVLWVTVRAFILVMVDCSLNG